VACHSSIILAVYPVDWWLLGEGGAGTVRFDLGWFCTTCIFVRKSL